MNKKISIGATITISAMVAAVVFSVTMIFSQRIYNNQLKNVSERSEQFQKLAEIDRVVNKNFLGDIDQAELENGISAGYIKGIGDPYSEYLSKDDLVAVDASLKGTFVGIGVKTKQSESGYIEIVEVYNDTPAKTAGLQMGDTIIKVGNIDVLTDYNAAIAALGGEADETVTIAYRRGTDDKTVELTKKNITPPTVYYKMLDEEVALIKITQFHDSTIEQFISSVDKAVTDGAKGIIFDVRDNGGGTLTSVAAMLDHILPAGTILTIKDVNGEETTQTSKASEVDLPMAVIGNENSASASELFIAALKDYKKGPFIGQTTYGKGVVQKFFPLKDGSAVRLTYAKFYSPKGNNYHDIGVPPDFEVKMTKEEYKVWKELPFDLDTPTEEIDKQLARATEAVKSDIRKVELGQPINQDLEEPIVDGGSEENPTTENPQQENPVPDVEEPIKENPEPNPQEIKKEAA